MIKHQSISCIFVLVVSVLSSFAHGDDKFGYRYVDGGIEIRGCMYYPNLDCPRNGPLVIPEEIDGHTVVGISDGAFADHGITSLTLPDTIRYIGKQAFQKNLLSNIIIPGNVTRIGRLAFAYNLLTEATIPEDILTFEEGVFARNSGITSGDFKYFKLNDEAIILGCKNNICPSNDLVIPQNIDNFNVTRISYAAFGVGGLDSYITLDDGMLLSSVSIPEGVKVIEERAFYRNELNSLSLPESLLTIGIKAFEDNNITNLSIPDNVTRIEVDAFFFNPIENLTIGNSVQYIGNSSLGGSYNSLVIPDSVEYIGGEALSGALENLTIGKNVSYIGYGAFSGNRLDVVVIPESVTYIGQAAFISNNNKTFYLKGDNIISGEALRYSNAIAVYYCHGRLGWIDAEITPWLAEPISPQIDETCDSDIDGVPNLNDAFPFDSTETLDTDEDGIGNNNDNDDDNDGFLDEDDFDPLDNTVGDVPYFSVFDIDQNGSFDALTDGLILLRYAFGLRGETLIENVISPNAYRTSSADIEAHIESHMP